MFLFTHIEKCGGTSFNEVLSLTYPRYFHVTKNKYGGNETRNDLTSIQYHKIMNYCPQGIGGHSVRPYFDFLPQSKRITFFRDPLERYLSQYNHMAERGWVTSIDDFLEINFYSNFITKKISGVDGDINYAITLLDNYEFIGDVNRYNKSLNYLQDVLHVKLIGSINQKNVRKFNKNYLNLNDLSEKQYYKAEQNNQLDIKLYEKYILSKNILNQYNDDIILKKPSKLRLKLLSKINTYKKYKIITPLRLE
ncbi:MULTISPECIES: sulfotransferase family 2 domain-containing protein [Winogradskyella]|uniref:Sulfotransferase family protein n=1 Tax=Winogradskyella thalassocola TaxID=262004 RepID=A0A1G8FYJ7_9FLAO|nr:MULTISPECIES: sulfotransferase family 2 domain-containing protein [Winogradskyella]SDH87165.1 Sulfotransferase family protein [Winogradskyella thalassocola]